jgi:hypothetical protein
LAFVEIALHRRRPDELPASGFFFAAAVTGYLLVAWVALLFAPPPPENASALLAPEYAPLLLVADTVIYGAFIWGVLKSFHHEKRFLQTATALIGVDALFTLASIPLLIWAGALAAADAATTAPSLIYWALLFWSIDVAGFVLSRAIGRPYVLAVFIVVGYVLLTVSLRASMFSSAS